MLRFVVGPSSQLVPDLAANLPGRGMWLTPRREAVERALAKKLFSRAARRPVLVPQGLAGHLEELLARRCCEGLGLARRSGLAVAGFEKVCEAVRAGRAALLLSAMDGAEGGRVKMRGLGRGLPIATVLSAAEIGTVFGRDHVVHVALGGGRLTARVAGDAEKLAGFRSGATVDREVGEAVARPPRHDIGIGSK